jgi:hypothetical protein
VACYSVTFTFTFNFIFSVNEVRIWDETDF